jgi:hypothetical protein
MTAKSAVTLVNEVWSDCLPEPVLEETATDSPFRLKTVRHQALPPTFYFVSIGSSVQ